MYIADIITLSRIVGSIVLMSLSIHSPEFIIIYTYCGISDALDGFIARKLKTDSKFGALLDSISDIVFYSVLMYKIWPVLNELLPPYFFIIIWTIFGVRVSCYMYVFAKEKKFAAEHFLLNKVTGLLLFLMPYLFKTDFFVIYCAIILVVASVAALYEYRFHLTGKK